MSLKILGVGTAVPGKPVPQERSLQVARGILRPTPIQDAWLTTLFTMTGIQQRHSCLGSEILNDVVEGTSLTDSAYLPEVEDDSGPSTGERMSDYIKHAAPLALPAVRAALDQAGLAARDITHLVTVSCTGFHAPGFDLELFGELGLSPSAQRTHLGFMGCHGLLNGLRVARAFVESDPRARILVCAVELCSLHYFYGWDPQKMIANALFADGAAALVGAEGSMSNGHHNHWKYVASASQVFPGTARAMHWRMGDHGFEMGLAKEVPDLIRQGLGPWLENWLDQKNLALADVGSWCIHPGGPRILDVVQESLNLTSTAMETSRAVFSEYGNMSSPTVLFILRKLMEMNAPRPVVALGFGPGLTAEAALFR
jgi:alpha-pyrone synthase